MINRCSDLMQGELGRFARFWENKRRHVEKDNSSTSRIIYAEGGLMNVFI